MVMETVKVIKEEDFYQMEKINSKKLEDWVIKRFYWKLIWILYGFGEGLGELENFLNEDVGGG